MSSPSSARAAQTGSLSRSRWCCSTQRACRKPPLRARAALFRPAASWLLRLGERLEVGNQCAHGFIVVIRAPWHLRLRVFCRGIAHVADEVGGRPGRKGGKYGPGNARLLSSIALHVVAAEAIPLGDFVSCLHGRIVAVRAERRNRAEDGLLIAKFEPHHAPWNLRLLAV